MVVRIWRGMAKHADAGVYRTHVTQNVFPRLTGLRGYNGAYLLQRETDGQIEFLAVTLWDSEAAIRAFAGNDIDVAIVEPEARAVLTDFDQNARHFEVTFESCWDLRSARPSPPIGGSG